jgi:hypothetical protein
VSIVEEDGRVVIQLKTPAPSRTAVLVGRGDVTMSTDEILALTRGE